MKFLLSLWTTKVKACIAVGLLAFLIYYFNHAKTVAYEQGVMAGSVTGWADAVKANRAQWDAEAKLLTEDAERLNQIDKQLKAQRGELDKTRQAMAGALTQTLNDIQSKNIQERQHAQSMPAADIVPNIRAILDALRRYEADRAARPGGTIAAQ